MSGSFDLCLCSGHASLFFLYTQNSKFDFAQVMRGLSAVRTYFEYMFSAWMYSKITDTNRWVVSLLPSVVRAYNFSFKMLEMPTRAEYGCLYSTQLGSEHIILLLESKNLPPPDSRKFFCCLDLFRAFVPFPDIFKINLIGRIGGLKYAISSEHTSTLSEYSKNSGGTRCMINLCCLLVHLRHYLHFENSNVQFKLYHSNDRDKLVSERMP